MAEVGDVGAAIVPRLALGVLLLGFGLLVQAAWIPAKALLAQQLLEWAWADTTPARPRVRPWPWADAHPVARLALPRDQGAHIVLAGTEGSAMAFAPTWLAGSAPPGAGGTAVIAAHRDTHFAGLEAMESGDLLRLELSDGRERRYRVGRREIHDVRDGPLALPADGIERLALVTCYPFRTLVPGGPLRYVVWATDEAAAPAL